MIFGIFGNTQKKELGSLLNEFITFLLNNGHKLVVHNDLQSVIEKNSLKSTINFYPQEEVIEKSDILLAFGGDGTILSVARLVGNSEIPIVGINLGKLGFLAEIGKAEVYDFIKDLLTGNYIIEERMMIEAILSEQNGKKLLGLNDIIIRKSQTSRLINIKAYVNDDHLITTMSDGIIVATPTGSTAYSMSSYGPIVAPSSKVLIINPICPHTLTVRPIIVPDDYEFRAFVESHNGEAMVTADGQVDLRLKTPFEIIIKKAEFPVKLIRRKEVSYYEVLRSKLMWGKDIRTV